MGKVFENLTWDDLCDMMCGGPEEDTEPRATEPRAVKEETLTAFSCKEEKDDKHYRTYVTEWSGKDCYGF